MFGNVVPVTVNNFKVIATQGINGRTYNGTRFHRVIKRFMIQGKICACSFAFKIMYKHVGGDIMFNNGSGVVSVYGKQFNDENFHIKHAAAGYVSMANSGTNLRC